ncbi:hypothetical protein ACOME3_004231, partial [Neoechinorhynchus agilis]
MRRMYPPSNLCRLYGRSRPDGVTVFPWREGKCILWDATFVDTIAASNIKFAALKSEEQKKPLRTAKRLNT